MVLPLMPPNVGTIENLPPEVRSLLGKAKYFVIGLWVFGGIFFIFNPISALSTLCLAIFGTFLLSEDPALANCYSCLRESLIGQCCGNGGLQMLAPFLLLSAINSLVDGVEVVQLLSMYGFQVLQAPAVDLLLGIWICELGSTIISWKVMKAILPTIAPPDNYQQLPGGMPGGFPGRMPPAGPGGSSPRRGPAAGGDPGRDFKPFSGQGHRLGG